MYLINLKELTGESLLFASWQYYIIPVLYIAAYKCISLWNNAFILLCFLYGVVPLIDHYVSADIRNPTKEEAAQL